MYESIPFSSSDTGQLVMVIIKFRDGIDWYRSNWVFRQLAADVIAAFPQDNELRFNLERASAQGALFIDEMDTNVAATTISALKTVAQDTIQGKVPGWKATKPTDTAGHQMYLESLAELLTVIASEENRKTEGHADGVPSTAGGSANGATFPNRSDSASKSQGADERRDVVPSKTKTTSSVFLTLSDVRHFEDQKFADLSDRDSGAVVRNLTFRRCHFERCTSCSSDPALRPTVRNAQLTDCSQLACSIGGTILEDVVVDGLNADREVLYTGGAVFKHVLLRGKIDSVFITPVVSAARLRIQEAFDRANARYYDGIDWALDISHGEFLDLAIVGVPAHLIRRDPETQIVVTREKTTSRDWKSIHIRNKLWRMALSFCLRGAAQSVVLVAGKQNPEFPDLVADLRMLQKTGLAEPD
jgi:hypothetical protein